MDKGLQKIAKSIVARFVEQFVEQSTTLASQASHR